MCAAALRHSATSHISPIFGVIFASIGSVEPRFTARQSSLPAPGFARHRYPSHEKSFADRKITLDHLRASSSHCFIFPHDPSDSILCPGNLPSADAGRPDLFQRMFSNLLHIFEADKTRYLFYQMIKTRRDFVGDKKPIVFGPPAQPVS